MITQLLLLIFAHFIGDFIFQNKEMSLYKNPNNMPVNFAGRTEYFWWIYFSIAHASMHGLFVALIFNNIYVGILETICHWSIDLGKCNQLYNVHTDFMLHIMFKLLLIILYGTFICA